MPTMRKIDSSRWGLWLTTTLFCALLFGCAASVEENSDGLSGNEPEIQSSEDPAGGEDGLTEKGLRRDFCCVFKTGNYVEYCENVYMTKIGVKLRCGIGDSVARDGRCSQYESCSGKTRNP